MRYRQIKKCINNISLILERVRNEFEFANIKESLGYYGLNAYIDVPILSINRPDRVFLGDGTFICRGSRLDVYDDEYSKSIRIGNGCYIAYNFSVVCNGRVEIQDHVLIASNVSIIAERHGFDPESEKEYMHQMLGNGDVFIHEGAYIGEKAVILPDVSIGKKSIIGAGSIVTRSIPDYCIAVGNPARIVKKYSFETRRWMRCADEEKSNHC